MISTKMIASNEEVLYSAEVDISIHKSDIQRLCSHPNTADLLHEMMIVHGHDAYVRPHMHPGKSESIHVIEGSVDVVLFDELGEVTELIKLGEYHSGERFYYRMNMATYHTLIIRSEILVFHEITNGPFDRSKTVFAPWAPEVIDSKRAAYYIANLEQKILKYQFLNR